MAYQKVKVRQLVLDGEEDKWVSQKVHINGWVYAFRVQGANEDGVKSFGFASIMDGSTVKHVQVIMDLQKVTDEESKKSIETALRDIKKGIMISAKGTMVACPSTNNKEQKTELLAEYITVHGTMDAAVYPIAKQKLPLETTRHKPHLRFRTKDMVAVNIIRNKAAFLIHKFYQDMGYKWANTPVLTANDCEGAGETFHVWCDEDEKLLKDSIAHRIKTKMDEEGTKAKITTLETKQKELVADAQKTLDEFKASTDSDKDKASLLKSRIKQIEQDMALIDGELEDLKDGLGLSERKLKSFFNDKVHLTVSGQLHGEAYAHGLTDIYTFGPTLRADPSVTSRHLAEFWMVEPEVGFITFDELMGLATDFVKTVVKGVMTDCKDEVEFLQKEHDDNLLATLKSITEDDYVRVSYTDTINMLKEGIEKHDIRVVDPATTSEKQLKKWAKKQYLITQPPVWGMDLKSEHERYLTDIIFKKPVIIYHYPKSLKPFYMKPSSAKYEEGETVDAMDLLIPFMGELIGGSMREDDYDALKAVMDEEGITEGLEWYLELRKYGSFPHGGFGLGFERLVKILTGMHSIRDVIGFPRYNGHIMA